MITVIPKRTFLLRQDDTEGGNRRDVVVKKNQKVSISEKEAIKFWGDFEFTDEQKKKLLGIAQTQNLKRVS